MAVAILMEATRVLVVNAGSSSLKLRVLGPHDELLVDEDLEAWDGTVAPVARRVEQIGAVGTADAVGHRFVHGGDRRAAVLVDEGVEAELAALTSLAPLHQPRSLAGVRAAREALPGVPAVACFDTTFHTSLPPETATYALPADWRERYGVRRYGFHGLSHAYAARRAAEVLGERTRRVVTCHLGAGASLAATLDGRSHDTTMGFTPLEGLVMATRAGSIDPGLVLWLATEAGIPPVEIGRRLEHESGLSGLAGGSGDVREVLRARAAGDDRAVLALAVYTHRLAREIAAMTVALGGLDALVFTGGVGEHVADVRAEAAARLGHLGVVLDEARNRAATGGDREIGAPGAAVRTLVLEAREDLEIARETRAACADA